MAIGLPRMTGGVGLPGMMVGQPGVPEEEARLRIGLEKTGHVNPYRQGRGKEGPAENRPAGLPETPPPGLARSEDLQPGDMGAYSASRYKTTRVDPGSNTGGVQPLGALTGIPGIPGAPAPAASQGPRGPFSDVDDYLQMVAKRATDARMGAANVSPEAMNLWYGQRKIMARGGPQRGYADYIIPWEQRSPEEQAKIYDEYMAEQKALAAQYGQEYAKAYLTPLTNLESQRMQSESQARGQQLGGRNAFIERMMAANPLMSTKEIEASLSKYDAFMDMNAQNRANVPGVPGQPLPPGVAPGGKVGLTPKQQADAAQEILEREATRRATPKAIESLEQWVKESYDPANLMEDQLTKDARLFEDPQARKRLIGAIYNRSGGNMDPIMKGLIAEYIKASVASPPSSKKLGQDDMNWWQREVQNLQRFESDENNIKMMREMGPFGNEYHVTTPSGQKWQFDDIQMPFARLFAPTTPGGFDTANRRAKYNTIRKMLVTLIPELEAYRGEEK